MNPIEVINKNDVQYMADYIRGFDDAKDGKAPQESTEAYKAGYTEGLRRIGQ